MAGIYILGLEMPKNGAERCIVIHGDGKISTFVGTPVDYAKAIPAADVVEVVRCRECVFGNTPCAMTRYPDYFCADGKRKDGGQGDG